MKFLGFGNNGVKKKQDFKNRILKQREPILDAFAESIKGARTCPMLLGQKCIGSLCEFFQKYHTVPDKKGVTREYARCNINQTPSLMLEMLTTLRENTRLLTLLCKVFYKTKEDVNTGTL